MVDQLLDEELLDALFVGLVELFDAAGVLDLHQGIGPLLTALHSLSAGIQVQLVLSHNMHKLVFAQLVRIVLRQGCLLALNG